jgi:hypothetical protein
MKLPLLASAAVLAAILTAIPAMADDPNDPAMRSAAARERDRAVIRRLNQQELARVRARDARYADGWRAYREAPARQAEYERRMAEWRRAVRLCNSGHHEYCAR